MLDRAIARAVPRVAEQRRRRVRTAERRVVADMDPGPARIGLAPGQNRNRGVVAMQAFRRQHMWDAIGSCSGRSATARAPTRSARVGRLRSTPFAGIAVSLPVQRLVLKDRDRLPKLVEGAKFRDAIKVIETDCNAAARSSPKFSHSLFC